MRLLLALVACGGAESDDPALRDALFDAQCRLYVEEACVAQMGEECGASIAFDTVEDCAGFLRSASSGCVGYVEALNAAASEVNACIEQIDAFTCGEAPMCGETPLWESDACAPVQEIATRCNADTGSAR